MQNCKRKKKHVKAIVHVGSYKQQIVWIKKKHEFIQIFLIVTEERSVSNLRRQTHKWVFLCNSPSKLHYSVKLFTLSFKKTTQERHSLRCKSHLPLCHTYKSSKSKKTPVWCRNTAHTFKSRIENKIFGE